MKVIQWGKGGGANMPVQDGTSAPVAMCRCITVGIHAAATPDNSVHIQV